MSVLAPLPDQNSMSNHDSQFHLNTTSINIAKAMSIKSNNLLGLDILLNSFTVFQKPWSAGTASLWFWL